MEPLQQRIKKEVPPIHDFLEEEIQSWLLDPDRLSIHDWERSQNVWHRTSDPTSLLQYDHYPINYEIKSIRDHSTGEISGWKEVVSDLKSNDLSMKRPPLPPSLATHGTANQILFQPGGFDLETITKSNLSSIIPDDEENETFMGETLLHIPPTFAEGIQFAEDGFSVLSDENKDSENAKPRSRKNTIELEEDANIKLESITMPVNHLSGLWSDSDDVITHKEKTAEKGETGETDFDKSLLDDCIIEAVKPMPDLPTLNISTSGKINNIMTSTEWAEMLDISKPILDFHTKIPNPAHKYDFELDNFQKLAIMKLEEQGNVFVAAHTSAGKTVVAEYAIALSKKHCTRTIYTSPIKALSNQKYRDFTMTFGDVGLLTGDLQINTTASCLVMTTEILRSMLYRGSDVIRDLEYVIFDEVHYINNAERGYVWEEVLILLPAHVSIVMLSATVPNFMEFADWVGRTKKRKVFVVSTLKRPVPLCHYLYTGSSGSSKNERFLILNQDGVFVQRGYDTALKAKTDRQSAAEKKFGPKTGKNFLNISQEKTLWVAFLDHLQKQGELPTVAFVLSRNRCDKISEALTSIDLTTAKEKSRIHHFIQICLRKLKGPDSKLPQVLRMQSLLMSGIGVHHSGILPILKEIVEMLFQSGLVKILFATETFAMGVNMPARSVVFDDVTKFDGMETRPLMPAEYIQMAGRAGRRGLDDIGNVIILCKTEVPNSMILKTMMQGKPMKLSSQFRVTYSTMLSLLRVPSVSVEGMMQRSFREFNQQVKADSYKKQLEEVEKVIETFSKEQLPPHLAALSNFYDIAADYIQDNTDLMPLLLEQSKNLKYLAPGRVLLITCEKYVNRFALLLNTQGGKTTPYKVLIVDYEEEDIPLSIEKDETWYHMMSLARGTNNLGSDSVTKKHLVISISPKSVIGLVNVIFKIDTSLIVQDWEKRQMARFRSDPPGNTCNDGIAKLSRLAYDVFTGTKKIELLNLHSELNIRDGEILKCIERVNSLSKQINSVRTATDIGNFEKEFSVVFDRKQHERKCEKLKRLLSYEAMALYPDYQRRLEVLRELRYIDDQNRVAMKGRVACEMKTNELIITELVFRNILTDLEPERIAALLSSLVFQARTKIQPTVDEALKKSMEEIISVDRELTCVEAKYLVGFDDPQALADRLNFGLVEVVYEWAKGKPFADIVCMTDVQEGIIVRGIQQLHEVLTNVRDAAKIIGDPMLQSKMDEVSVTIKRDIVFFASLYTQDDILK